MTSLERHLRAFVRVMPRRAKIIANLIKKKRIIDAKILKNNNATPSDIEEWKSIVGKDTLFRSAEKRDRQSIRHYLWKIQKSLKYFNTSQDKFKKMIAEGASVGKYAKVYSNLLNLFNTTKIETDLLARIDNSLIEQVKALEQTEQGDYRLETFRDQIRLQESISQGFSSTANEILSNSRSAINLVRRLPKSISNDIAMKPVIIAWVILAMTSMAAILGIMIIMFIGGIALVTIGLGGYVNDLYMFLVYLGEGIIFLVGGVLIPFGIGVTSALLLKNIIQTILKFAKETI